MRRLQTALIGIAVALAACGGPAADPPADAQQEPELSIAVASFDLSVGGDERLLAGVYTPTRELLAFGEVDFEIGPVAEGSPDVVEITQRTVARWLPVPGAGPQGDDDRPRLLTDEPGTGVYAADVDLDQSGIWALRVVAELADGSTLSGQTIFEVQPEPLVPAVGDEAPRVANLTIADVESGAVPPIAVDSRAQSEDDEVPDPHLHTAVIPESIDEGRPVVVAVTTPVYCVSRFCGPLTEVISEMAHEYDETADFVHVEVWENFDEQQLTDAAAAWIQTEIGGNEPWVFLVDADGTIVARWDNVLDVEELEAALKAL